MILHPLNIALNNSERVRDALKARGLLELFGGVFGSGWQPVRAARGLLELFGGVFGSGWHTGWRPSTAGTDWQQVSRSRR